MNSGVKGQSANTRTTEQNQEPSRAENVTHGDLAAAYFDRSRVRGVKGTVETPEWLVDQMIDVSIKALNEAPMGARDLGQVRWLDPCCGAGAFVVGLIRKYVKEAGVGVGITDLPFVTAIDLMPDALDATRVGIAELLENHSLDIDDYFDSGRLVLETSDFLKLARDTPTLTDAWHAEFDVVIGNPPYIRSRDWLPEQRASVRDGFPEIFRGGCDLYGYFYIAAMNVVRIGGVVSFVTPFSFIRVSSARDVRARLHNCSRLRSVIDLGETGVFTGVDLHAGIFTFRREAGDRRAEWGTVTSVVSKSERLMPNIEWRRGVVAPNAVGGWHLAGASTPNSDGVTSYKTMSECGIGIYSGIRPGVSEAFLVSHEQRAQLRDPRSMKFIRPVITAREIQPWRSESHRYWIIDSRGDGSELSDELMAHLGQFREVLEGRPEVGKTAQWYQLRSCNYMNSMMRAKIAFPDISKEQRFSIVPPEMLILDGAFFVDSSRPALLGILNSAFARAFFEANCPVIGSPQRGGRLRYKKSVLAQFPLPPHWPDGSSDLMRLDDLISRVISAGEVDPETDVIIDELVEKIYGSEFQL